MSELLSFTIRPDCPKCGSWFFDRKYVPTSVHIEGTGECPVAEDDTGEHLDLTCRSCGYTIGMKTKDAR